MPIIFYPHEEDLASNTLASRLEVMTEAADRYKTVILDVPSLLSEKPADKKPPMVPNEIKHAFNWNELAKLLREIRELPETNQAHKLAKADKLAKLAEIYEVLRAAKMSKLEAVRLALVNEAKQL